MQHIAEANDIFRTTDLDLDAVPDNFGFKVINLITVYKSASANHQIGDSSLEGNDLINRFSRNDFDEFCLAIAFTCRDLGQLLSSSLFLSVNQSINIHRIIHATLFFTIVPVFLGGFSHCLYQWK